MIHCLQFALGYKPEGIPSYAKVFLPSNETDDVARNNPHHAVLKFSSRCRRMCGRKRGGKENRARLYSTLASVERCAFKRSAQMRRVYLKAVAHLSHG